MKIQFRGHNFELSEFNKEIVIDKINTLQKYFESEQLTVKVSVTKFQRSTEVDITIVVDNNLRVHSKQINYDFYSALVLAIDKLETRIKKRKYTSGGFKVNK
ncbi:ribosome-associated translation inhibitor RaiA [Bacillus mexicanus]|uniref:ribosome hibernation-promoting factor, HPF/YfiA family n=1 Tax=Bacillus mexicanus TaxID=2834415 RepID=UPI003D25FCDF